MDYKTWRLDRKEAEELYYPDYEDMAKTKDVLGHRELVSGLWKGKDRMGLVLYGPDGCGKHTAAAYCIDSIPSGSSYCQFLFLQGRELERDFPEVGTLIEYLNCFLDDSFDGKVYYRDETSGEPVCETLRDAPHDACIVLECPTAYTHWQELQSFLYKSLSQYLRETDFPRLFLILISTEPIALSAFLQRRMGTLAVCRPGAENRDRFLEKACKEVFGYVRKETLVKKTEGMSFSQIRNVVRNVVRVGMSLTKEELEGFLESQMPMPTAAEHRMAFEEKLPAVLAKLTMDLPGALESMAQALKEMPKGVVQVAGTPGDQTLLQGTQMETLDEDATAQQRRAELEAMPPKEAMISIFGQDRISRYLQEQGVE